MTDQDLTAEARKLASSRVVAGRTHSEYRAFQVAAQLADELEKARARIAELEQVTQYTTERAVAAEGKLEAVERDWLGYVVLRGNLDYDDLTLVDQRVWRSDFEGALDSADRSDGVVYELRVVPNA